MSKIQIMTDSASDISSADERNYSIEVIPFPIALGDWTYISRVDFNNEQFFSLMAQYDELPKTAQITPFQFQEIYFGIYNLKYAAKSGRIPSAVAFVGTALNLKPVMKIFDHSITTAAKCRGERKLVEKVAEMSIADMEPGTPYELIYGDDATCLEELRRLIVPQFDYEPAGSPPDWRRRRRQLRPPGGGCRVHKEDGQIGDLLEITVLNTDADVVLYYMPQMYDGPEMTQPHMTGNCDEICEILSHKKNVITTCCMYHFFVHKASQEILPDLDLGFKIEITGENHVVAGIEGFLPEYCDVSHQ